MNKHSHIKIIIEKKEIFFQIKLNGQKNIHEGPKDSKMSKEKVEQINLPANYHNLQVNITIYQLLVDA